MGVYYFSVNQCMNAVVFRGKIQPQIGKLHPTTRKTTTKTHTYVWLYKWSIYMHTYMRTYVGMCVTRENSDVVTAETQRMSDETLLPLSSSGNNNNNTKRNQFIHVWVWVRYIVLQEYFTHTDFHIISVRKMSACVDTCTHEIYEQLYMCMHVLVGT